MYYLLVISYSFYEYSCVLTQLFCTVLYYQNIIMQSGLLNATISNRFLAQGRKEANGLINILQVRNKSSVAPNAASLLSKTKAQKRKA